VAQRLRWPAHVPPVGLPPSGPERNPLERGWRDVQDDLAWQQCVALEAHRSLLGTCCKPMTHPPGKLLPAMHSWWQPFMHCVHSTVILGVTPTREMSTPTMPWASTPPRSLPYIALFTPCRQYEREADLLNSIGEWTERARSRRYKAAAPL